MILRDYQNVYRIAPISADLKPLLDGLGMKHEKWFHQGEFDGIHGFNQLVLSPSDAEFIQEFGEAVARLVYGDLVRIGKNHEWFIPDWILALPPAIAWARMRWGHCEDPMDPDALTIAKAEIVLLYEARKDRG